MSKTKKTEWVLVETVAVFRNRYVVEVPAGKELWALDTVAMEEAKEFSSEYLGENTSSYRTMSYKEAMALCDQDNDYCTSWTEEHKAKTFLTSIADMDALKNEKK